MACRNAITKMTLAAEGEKKRVDELEEAERNRKHKIEITKINTREFLQFIKTFINHPKCFFHLDQ